MLPIRLPLALLTMPRASLTAACRRLFIAYPLLSHAALRSFDCVTIGQQRLMRLDMQLDCPMYHPSSAAFSWALVLCVVYPFGM